MEALKFALSPLIIKLYLYCKKDRRFYSDPFALFFPVADISVIADVISLGNSMLPDEPCVHECRRDPARI